MSNRRSLVLSSALAGAAALCVSGPLHAQGALAEKLQVHGYLTQGYAQSGELPILGISEGGTANYRTAALQFRYGITEKDNFVLQFSHRDMGTSLFTSDESSVMLDWAFYQRRFGNGSVRVGRGPIPLGIYNEVRDVGTILPFYRAPSNFYYEGFETLDGASANYDFALGGGWGFEANAYAGEFSNKSVSRTATATRISNTRFDHVAGTQLWLSTPVTGLRVGAGGLRFRLPESTLANGQKTPSVSMNAIAASLDGNFDRFLARGEYRVIDTGPTKSFDYYAQAGVKLPAGLSINAQADFSDKQRTSNGSLERYLSGRDLGLGINYAPSPNIVLKVEGHRAEGYGFDMYLPRTAPGREGDYGIASISVSF